MSDDIVIRAENVSKRYRISHLAGQTTLRDTVHHAARLAWRRLRWNTKLSREDFWALRDINFEIKRGEVVGIIGRNGAGKSTLLKTLSRITEPTTGRITLKDRVASLLEVGTGFHPELTGRDNIYLNGAILGMRRAEIRKKFDEIVAFAEVERFLDTPVKRYSSGMYVRLAFAVAAHLEPEILIVDEVLAVGDAAFQQKCIGKLRSVTGEEGRTVLFVSHNLAAIRSLCATGILLDQGFVRALGDIDHVTKSYLDAGSSPEANGSFSGKDPSIRIDQIELDEAASVPSLRMKFTLRTSRRRRIGLEFHVLTATGTPVGVAAAGTFASAEAPIFEEGEHVETWGISLPGIATGTYRLALQIVDPAVEVLARHEHTVDLEIVRLPAAEGRIVMQQHWQAGHVEFPCRRV